jgi:hypothetical protein
MIPRRIQNATHALGAPLDWDSEKHGNCVRLWVRAEGGTYASAWEPTPDELDALNAGGSVVLTIVGGQPPVALHVETPETE